MKLSTQTLNKKLQRIGPLNRLSRKLGANTGRAKGNGNKRKVAKSPSDVGPTLKVDNNAAVDSTSSFQTDSPQSGSSQSSSSQSGSSQSGSSQVKRKAAVPAFIKNSKLVKNSKSARVAFHLLLVKPWVLVVGLWLVSALSAVIALEGLISPSKLKQALPEPAEVAPVAKADSFINVEQSGDGLTAEENSNASDNSADRNVEVGESTSEVLNEEVTAVDSRFPVWPLVMLVGSCAAGCVVISRRRAMLRMATTRPRNRGRKLPGAKMPLRANGRVKASNSRPIRRTGANGLVALVKSAARSTSGAENRIDKGSVRIKKRRQRKRLAAQPPTTKGTSSTRVLASRSNAQQAAPRTRVSKPGKPQRPTRRVARSAKRRQAIVSVVPASQSHRLDWTEGSLAHDMDVRQRAL